MKPKKENWSQSRYKKISLKVTIVEFVKKKKKEKWLHIPLTKISRLQCVAKKILRPKEKSSPPPYLMVAPLICRDAMMILLL